MPHPFQGIYAPGKIEGGYQIQYEDSLATTSAAMFDNYRAVLDSYAAAAATGALPRLNATQLRQQSALLKDYSTAVKAAAGSKQQSGEWERS